MKQGETIKTAAENRSEVTFRGDPLFQGEKHTRETAENVVKNLVNENKYAVHTKAFEEELREAPAITVRGFTGAERLAKKQALQDKKGEYDKALDKLDELKERNADEEDIEEVEKKIDKLIAEMKEIATGVRQTPESFLDDDEIRLMVKRVVPAHLREFMEKFCRIEYDPDMKQDQIAVTDEGKIVFKFGPSLLNWQQQGEKKVPRVDKVMFQLGRMVGALVHEPSSWKDYVKKVRVLEGKAATWEDFVALYLTDPTYAQTIAPEAAAAAKKQIDQMKTAGEATGQAIVKNFRERHPDGKTFATDFEYATGKQAQIGLLGRSISFIEKARTFKDEMTDRLWGAFRELVPYKQSDWYERTLVEFEDKEVSRILARDEHVTDRHKRLKTFYDNHDEFGARTLIKSMTHTGDSRWWVYHSYLMTFDPLYQKTGGEEITKESYSFLVQCLRISHVGKRHGTKPGEYAPIKPRIPGGRMRIKRITREQWEGATTEEIDKKSMRDLLAVAQEAYEWMETERVDGKLGHFEIDEVFGAKYTPFGLEKNWDHARDRWQEETNNMRNLFDEDFLEKVHRNVNRHRQEDRNQGWYKLDPDQVLMLARLIAARELFETGEYQGMKLPPRAARDPFDSEHFKLAQKRAVFHYRERVKQYRDHVSRGGDTIPAYERFLHLIEQFKEKETETARLMLELGRSSDEDYEAEEVVDKEPVIALQEDTETTAATITTVEKTEKKLKDQLTEGTADKGDKKAEKHGGIEQLDINNKLKRELKRNPRLVLDLLDDPETLHEKTDEIFGLKRPDEPAPYAAYRELHNKHYGELFEDYTKVREFYSRNKAQFDAYFKMNDWLTDVRAFKKPLGPAAWGEGASPFDRKIIERKDELFGDFSAKHDTLVSGTSEDAARYKQAMENKDWTTAKGILEHTLGRRLEKKEEEKLSKMATKNFAQQVKDLFAFEARKKAQEATYQEELEKVKQTLEKIVVLRLEDQPMPQYQFRYLERADAPALSSLSPEQYERVIEQFDLLQKDEAVLAQTALWRQAATKRDRLSRDRAATDHRYAAVVIPPEYEITDQDRPKWLYYQLRMHEALLNQKINEVKKEELSLEEGEAPAPAT